MRRAVFLDRDGTLTEEGDWHVKAAPPRLLPGVTQALRRLQDAGFLLFVVTNQSGVARGYYTEEDVRVFHRRMEEMLAEQGVRLQGISYCPHMPDEGCACRKPGTRYLAESAARHNIDLARSFVVGDQSTDIAMGVRNGCRTILVCRGFDGADEKTSVEPDRIASDVTEAAALILALDGRDDATR
ncbi:MAG: HAD-IIIA family hydrolase [Phycisphaerae bacterium]|nr:HAD-IIIA family hydrolase [Phycisphaerae bacterium]